MPLPTPTSSLPASSPDAPVLPDAALLRRVTDAAPLQLAYVGADLRYRFVSRMYFEWFGYPSESLLGRLIPDVIGASSWERIRPHIETVLAGTPVTYEGQTPHADGYRFVRTSLVPDRDPESGNVIGFVASVTDISDRREMELNLADSEERLRSLFEYTTDAVFAFDIGGYFVSANRAGETLSGYSSADLMQTSLALLLVPGDQERAKEHFQSALRGEVQNYEATLLHQDGHQVEFVVTNTPIYARGKIVGVYGIARDITEEKRTARLLAEAAGKQRRFVREMLFSLTEGRLCLCEDVDDLPDPLPLVGDPILLTRSSLRTFRRAVTAIAEASHLCADRTQELITAAGEASMNAVVHAGGGQAEVRADLEKGIVQVWVRDNGSGISEDALHRATLEKGYTTAGTLGHGFWMMLKTADRIYLLTGPHGTTVVLEQERSAPDPHWLRDR